MRIARHGLAWLGAALLALVGCYEAHGLGGLAPSAPDAGGRARPDAGAGRDAGAAPDAGTDAGTRACAFVPVAPWQLTSPPGDQSLHSAATLRDGFLVAWGSSNDPPPVPGRFARRVTLHRPNGPAHELFGPARGPFLGGVGLAFGPRGGLATVWDGRGCRVRPLGLDGRPSGVEAPLPLDSCSGVHARSDGFGLFDRPGSGATRLHALGRDGALTHTGPRIPLFDDAFWWAHVALGGDERLLLSMTPGVEPSGAQAGALAPDGTPSERVATLPPFGAASRLRAVGTRAGALVAWLENADGDPTSQERDVVVFPVDRAGEVLAPPRVVSSGVAYRDAGIALTAHGESVWLAYVEVEPGDRGGAAARLVLLGLDGEGALRSRHLLVEAPFVRTPIVRASDEGVLVAYQAHAEVATQVFVSGLECL
ncbi:MAG: hypothetical protein KF729_04830 [Sandaracinaceae bacterium]|nr:hypothetical protein [Sandaracinaceae bacterium]